MKHEHFGIAVVELMSSGMITIAHNSAGPKTDIIGPAKKPVGYLADDLESYAFFLKTALLKYEDKSHTDMRHDAREWIQDQFGVEAFNTAFIRQIGQLIDNQKKEL